ncbi:LCP family protein [Microbacterium sp. cx-55]|uniref:LCP family protein n=1 Tax=Microbacterium sp. cx-55 TaxID=2875948 RepID=UPI001CBD25DC|nr:LCP family protein [Microbacterium sp. cx-55]MBZ4487079.1 LCP family protein [Microbacterium sp. cx-55]UGB36653.1 LCP family protein [Microbacterium sp. cx-55]
MTSAARPRGAGASSRSVVNPYPLRYPDSSSRAGMTRRAWWLVGMNILVPGSAQVLAGNRRLGRIGLGATLFLWGVVIVGGAIALLSPSAIIGIAAATWIPEWLSALRSLPLLIAQGVLLLYGVLWAVLTIDTLRLVRFVKIEPWARIGTGIVAIVVMVLSTGGAVYASNATGAVRDTLSSVFTQSGPAIPPVDGYYNILLLGADSGEGRDSMRFDSISVVSVNADTGAVSIFGIPRDMPNFPFAPGPMQDKYPDGHESHDSKTCGWGSGINQLRTEVEVCQDGNELYPDAVDNGSEPGVEATKDAAEGILGIEIPYYAFIDMDGFAALVDALGGVNITVTERLPEGGGPAYAGQPAEDWAIGWIEAGEQHMDGNTAQWYARSRYTTNDWDRMRRQRELQEAILAQATPANVLTRFQEVATAGQHLVKTDIPQSMLGYFVELAMKAKEQPVTTVEMTPATGIDDRNPDYAHVQELVQQTLHPVAATETPAG